MAEHRVERKLAAILAADVVGYSRLMERDEAGTLARLRALRRELFEPKTKEYRGRIFKTTGDGALVEFKSAADAVASAVEIQRALTEREAGVAEDRRIRLRIGISLGDVIVEGSDLYGRGVNVAARMESLAEPGGICITGNIYDHVKGAVDLAFDDLGKQEVKNIATPIHAYRAQLGGDTNFGIEQLSFDASPTLPDKPSIAVLPFQNMSGDPDQDYFADGVVEDIITGLSRLKWLFVIARNSTFVYKGQSIDVKKVGRELGVRYVLEGSVRKAGSRVRLTAQLIDADTGAHVWADRYDGALDDIFDLQDQITASVIGVVEPSLRQAEIERARRKPPENLDAYDLYLRAFPLAYANTPEDGQKALALLEEALRLDPTYSAAHGIAAWCHEQLYNRLGFREENKVAGLRHAEAAITYGGDDPTALCMAGFTIAMVSRDVETALNAIDRSLALNASYATGFAFSSIVRAFAGQYETAVEHALRAIRLNPLDPMGAQPYISLTFAYLPLGRFEEAATAAAKAIQLNPKFSYAHALNVICLVKLGRIEAARTAAARLLELVPFKVQMIMATPIDPKVAADWADALRSAGVPG